MSAGHGIKSTGTTYQTNSRGFQHTRKRSWVLSFSFISAIKAFFPPSCWNVSFLAKNPSTWHLVGKWSPYLLVKVPSNSLRNTNLFSVWFTWSECTARILGHLYSKERGDKGLAYCFCRLGPLSVWVPCRHIRMVPPKKGLGKQRTVPSGVACTGGCQRNCHNPLFT